MGCWERGRASRDSALSPGQRRLTCLLLPSLCLGCQHRGMLIPGVLVPGDADTRGMLAPRRGGSGGKALFHLPAKPPRLSWGAYLGASLVPRAAAVCASGSQAAASAKGGFKPALLSPPFPSQRCSLAFTALCKPARWSRGGFGRARRPCRGGNCWEKCPHCFPVGLGTLRSPFPG